MSAIKFIYNTTKTIQKYSSSHRVCVYIQTIQRKRMFTSNGHVFWFVFQFFNNFLLVSSCLTCDFLFTPTHSVFSAHFLRRLYLVVACLRTCVQLICSLNDSNVNVIATKLPTLFDKCFNSQIFITKNLVIDLHLLNDIERKKNRRFCNKF